MTDVDVRRALQVAYSVRMVADVATSYDRALDDSDMPLGRFMLDSFYVHVRLLGEFFLRPTGPKDFGPSDFGVEWRRPTGERADRLNEAWTVASQYVMHFGRPRVPDSIDDLRAFHVNGAYFRQLADDVLAYVDDFTDALEAAAPAWDGGVLLPNREREPDQWTARVRHEVVQTLRNAETGSRAALAAIRPS